jgi:hypothetical protein
LGGLRLPESNNDLRFLETPLFHLYSSRTLVIPGSLMAFNPVSIIFIWGELGKRLMEDVGCARPT